METGKILIGTKTYPVRIDLNVIELIEEQYETVGRFEQELFGWRWKRDESGKYAKDEDDNPLVEYVNPSTQAMKWILPIVINEGLKKEAYENGNEYIPVDSEQIIMDCNVEPNYIREIIWKELQRSRSVKKPIPREESRN